MKKIKNMVRGLLFLSFIVVLSLSTYSCDDYLDVDEYIDQMTSLDSVFSRKSLLEQYINGAAGYLPNEGNLWSEAPTPFQMASDENFASWNDDRHAGMKFLLDEVTPFSSYYNNYAKYYQGIRMANTVLQRIQEVPDISDIDRRDFIGRCYFLVGYYYKLLLLQYGPTPILPDTPFKPDESVENMSFERATYDEVIAHIRNNLTLAAQYLPLERESSGQITVPTRWAALGALSRITLYAASPWYNGNTFYADWIRKSDGAHFISQQADNSKWGISAAYSKYIIDSGNFELFISYREIDTPPLVLNVTSDPNYYKTYPEGAAGIDPFRSYSYLFNGEVPVVMNKEMIYSCAPRSTTDSPLWIAAPYTLGGGNGLNLTQDMINAYYMKDGHDINSSSIEYPYPDSDHVYEEIGGGGYTFSGYTLKGGVAKMYNNREARFYVTIGFCHTFWPGTSYTGPEAWKNIEVTYYSDGYAAPNPDHPEDYNRTGYTCKKYIHPEDNLKASNLVKTKYFPTIRYAEILLNYVEAINELESSYTMEIINGESVTVERKVSDIVKYFNLIRYRAGLPGITESDAADRGKVRELIKRERQIEFMCEGRRYHDLRRWGKDAMEAYNKPITAMNVKAKRSQRKDFYTITTLNDKLTRRSFSYKNYFWPIPKSVMDKNKKLVQNPEW